MTLTTDQLFIAFIVTINTLVWALFFVPQNRRKHPKIYLIARSWWWMLALLFSSYLLSVYSLFWWLLEVLLVVIGLRGCYEIARLLRHNSKIKFIAKLRRQQDKETQESNTQITAILVTNATIPTPRFKRVSLLDIGFSIAFIGLIISFIMLSRLTIIREQPGVLLFVLFASQFNDIAQYLCGRWMGNRLFKRKLAPIVSPNKTIEGVLLGSLLSASLATVLGLWLTSFSALVCFGIAYFLAVSGIAGDLFESAFKRRHGIKDTGTILAGHGGILDRVDSLLIGVPVFTVVYWLVW
ncbi:phosphatidate cytidylyltransferase [uncultured Psychrobacter sp.]|uniref:phosphatidate cytidylyltransferase n=1 Tax=uncultured Psychrobacter sp. TaxID=259303 RepID=UPI003458CBA2